MCLQKLRPQLMSHGLSLRAQAPRSQRD
jgi:hypothetical protein